MVLHVCNTFWQYLYCQFFLWSLVFASSGRTVPSIESGSYTVRLVAIACFVRLLLHGRFHKDCSWCAIFRVLMKKCCLKVSGWFQERVELGWGLIAVPNHPPSHQCSFKMTHPVKNCMFLLPDVQYLLVSASRVKVAQTVSWPKLYFDASYTWVDPRLNWRDCSMSPLPVSQLGCSISVPLGDCLYGSAPKIFRPKNGTKILKFSQRDRVLCTVLKCFCCS